MSFGEGGGGHFADTGGYGSFNQGGGGFQSGGSLSGGRGEYGLAGDRSFNSGNVGAYSQKSAGGSTSLGSALQAYQKKQAQLAAAKKAAAAAAAAVQINPKTGLPVTTAQSFFDPYEGYPTGEMFETANWPQWAGGSWQNANTAQGPVLGDVGAGAGGTINSGVSWGSKTGAAGRQFGGPVAPGGQYTVGENGPETLQMGPGGGGQVIPHNPADRLGGMNPNTMRDMFQLQMGQMGNPVNAQQPPGMAQGKQTLAQWQANPTMSDTTIDRNAGPVAGGPMKGPGPGGPGQPPMAPPGEHSTSYPPIPPGPQVSPGPAPGPGGRPDMQAFHQLLQQWRGTRPDMAGLQGPERRDAMQDWRGTRPQRPMGTWQNRMGIEGLSRPRQDMGFGGSGLGQPGLMNRMRGMAG
jgi:hypothetical protein